MFVQTRSENLRWLDLRGNHIQQVPTSSIGNQGGNRLPLDKLDLGENLISRLGEDAMFNQSLQVINVVNRRQFLSFWVLLVLLILLVLLVPAA